MAGDTPVQINWPYTASLGRIESKIDALAREISTLTTKTNRLGVVMGEVQDAVDAIVVQLGKAKDEILAEIANLEAQIAAGETPDLTALKAAAQALDDVVPDAPVE
jgi:hypothetical protein